MRLGLLQDPAVIDRQIKKELQAAEAARHKAAAPTVMTEAEMKADEAMTEKEKETIRKKAEEKAKPRIRPLSEQKAIEMGANFAAETFIFAVGIGVIVFEQWRQRRKARNARDDIREDLDEVKDELKAIKAGFAEYKEKHLEPAPSSGLLGLWKGTAKTDKKQEPEKPTSNKDVNALPPTTQALTLEPSSKPPTTDEKAAAQQTTSSVNDPRHA